MEELKKQFLEELQTKSADLMASLWIIDTVPYIFGGNSEDYAIWRNKLAKLIEVDPSALIVTGSSNIGFSLNPYKNFKLFDQDSDIDVAIVSDYHFNQAWRTLRNLGADLYDLSASGKQSVKDHASKYIYWGTIATDRILQLLPFAIEWNNAFNKMCEENPTKGRKINARIYKDFDSLRAYQVNNLKNIRLSEIEKGVINVKIS